MIDIPDEFEADARDEALPASGDLGRVDGALAPAGAIEGADGKPSTAATSPPSTAATSPAAALAAEPAPPPAPAPPAVPPPLPPMHFDPAQLTGYIDACVAAQVAQVSSQMRTAVLGECEARFAAHRTALLQACDARLASHRAAVEASLNGALAGERRLGDRLRQVEAAQHQHSLQLHHLVGTPTPAAGGGGLLLTDGSREGASTPAPTPQTPGEAGGAGREGVVGELYTAVARSESNAVRQLGELERQLRSEVDDRTREMDQLRGEVAALSGSDVVDRMGALEQQTLRLLEAVQALQLADEAQKDYQGKASLELQGSVATLTDQLMQLERRVQEGRVAAADTAVALAERLGSIEAKGASGGALAVHVRELAERLDAVERGSRESRDRAAELGVASESLDQRVLATEGGHDELRHDAELLKSAVAGLAKKMEAAQLDAAADRAEREEANGGLGGDGAGEDRPPLERLAITEDAVAEMADSVDHVRASLERLVAGLVGAEGRISLLEEGRARGGASAGASSQQTAALERAVHDAEARAAGSYAQLRDTVDGLAHRVSTLEQSLREDQEASLRALEALMASNAGGQ